MQVLKPLHINQFVTIHNQPLEVVGIKTFNNLADYARIIHLQSVDSDKRYRLVQWKDGCIYRITEVTT